MACWSAGATAVASSAEMMIACAPCVVAVWMNGTCCVASAALGPTCVACPPRSDAAFWTPLNATSKYGLLICFGMTTALAPPAAPVEAEAEPEAAADEAGADAEDEAASDDAGADDAAVEDAAVDAAAELAGAVLAAGVQADTASATTAVPASSRERRIMCASLLLRALLVDLARGDRTRRHVPTSPDPVDEHPGLASKLGGDDRADQKQPHGHVLVLARDTGEA